MLRPIASCLMLVGFVAGQWAAMPHGHAAPMSAEHDDRPHVHLSGREHPHSHGDSPHTHTHPAASPTENQDEDVTCAFASTGIDHDADAVYLAGSGSESSNRVNAGTSAADVAYDWQSQTAAISFTDGSSIGTVVSVEGMAGTFAPCLEMRALRI